MKPNFRWDILLPTVAIIAGGIMVTLSSVSSLAFKQRDALALDGRVLGLAHMVELRLRDSGINACEEIAENALEQGTPDVLGIEMTDTEGRTLALAGSNVDDLDIRTIELFVGPGGKGMSGERQGRGGVRADRDHPGAPRGRGRVTLTLRLAPEAGHPPLAVRLLPATTIAVAIALFALSILGGRQLMRQRLQAVREAEEHRLLALARAGAGLAHQLRTPLATMKGSCQLLDEQIADPTHRKRLQTTLKQVDRMDKMLGMLLDFATPPAPQTQMVEIRHWLTDLEDRHHDLVIGPIDDLTLTIDPEHLSLVLDNLIDNARAVSDPDGRIEISAAIDKDRVEIVVADRGPGPGPDPEKLFEPYLTYRADGTGLGLAIARTLTEANRGSLNLRARDQGGCEAVLSLPVGRSTE